MEHQVYYFPGKAALAILVNKQPQKKISITCRGREVVQSLEMTEDCLGLIRVVNWNTQTYTYCGAWMIASVQRLSEDEAIVTMLGVLTD